MTLAGLFCFIGNFSFPIKQKTLREDAHLAEKKLAVNSTARARKSRKRLFVLMATRKMVMALWRNGVCSLKGGCYGNEEMLLEHVDI